MNNTFKIKNKHGKEEEVIFYSDEVWTCTCPYFTYQRQSNRKEVECYHVKRARIQYEVEVKKENEEYITDEHGNRLGKVIIH